MNGNIWNNADNAEMIQQSDDSFGSTFLKIGVTLTIASVWQNTLLKGKIESMLIVVLKNLRDIVKSLLECYMEKKSFELISPMNFSVWVSLADRGKLVYHSIFQ